MNRLTDALYMVRFKVRPGVGALDPEQPGRGGRARLDRGVGPPTPPSWQQTLAEVKGAGPQLWGAATDSLSSGPMAPLCAQHAVWFGIGFIRCLSL